MQAMMYPHAKVYAMRRVLQEDSRSRLVIEIVGEVAVGEAAPSGRNCSEFEEEKRKESARRSTVVTLQQPCLALRTVAQKMCAALKQQIWALMALPTELADAEQKQWFFHPPLAHPQPHHYHRMAAESAF